MKLAHNIKMTVFIKPEEDEQLLKDRLISLAPFSIEEGSEENKEKIALKRTTARGFGQKQIIIYELVLEKEKHTNAFLKFFASKLDEPQKKMLVRQENRIDDKLDFFIRLDKESLLNNQYNITDCGECFHIRIALAAFPKKKEIAKAVVEMIFS